MSEHEVSVEERVLAMVKRVLTDIAKETFTRPGHVHPLSDATIQNMRDCMGLIAAREAELREADGRGSAARPRFIDEPKSTVVVPISSIKKKSEE